DPGGVQIRPFDLGDPSQVLPGQGGHGLMSRPSGPLFDSRSPLEKKSGGRRFGLNGEGTVLKYGDFGGDDEALLSGGQLVVFLAESEQIDPGRCQVLSHLGRIGLSRFQLQFQLSDHVFCHVHHPSEPWMRPLSLTVKGDVTSLARGFSRIIPFRKVPAPIPPFSGSVPLGTGAIGPGSAGGNPVWPPPPPVPCQSGG